MKNQKGQPVCGKSIEGPPVRTGGRTRPLWWRGCLRVVQTEGTRCWQHRDKEND